MDLASAPHPRPNRTLSLPLLDGLRGIAIFMVFMFHFGDASGFARIGPIRQFLLSGWAGVDLFFVISGFLLTTTIRGKPLDFGGIKRFYIRRLLRIFPLYYLFTFGFIAATIAVAFSGFNVRLLNWAEVSFILTFTQNLPSALLHSSLPLGLNHFWSLAVEVQLYVLLPWILRSKIAVPVLITGVLVSISARQISIAWTDDTSFAYFSTISRMDGFCLGALIALHDRLRQWLLNQWLPIVIGAVASLTALMVSGKLHFDQPAGLVFGIPAFCALFGTAVAHAASADSSPLLRSVLAARILTFLGTISYGVYVLHYPLLFAMRGVLIKAGFSIGQNFMTDLIFLAAWTAVTIVLAWLSYRYFESAFLKMKPRSAGMPQSNKAPAEA